jgi:hypothetical protein
MAGKIPREPDIGERIERHVVESEIDPEAIPESGDTPDVAVTADFREEQAPVTGQEADDLTPDTLIGDPREEQLRAADEDAREALSLDPRSGPRKRRRRKILP